MAHHLAPGSEEGSSEAVLSLEILDRNGLFALRLYNLSSNFDSKSDYSYLGIFYRNDTNLGKPLWIANRNRPITDNSGALAIDQTGKLMITYICGGAPLELYSGQSGTEVSAVLQDNGNLVLKQGITERILWQTFNFPTDCFLPGMKLGINHMTGQNWSHTSWLTDSISAPGAFSLNWAPGLKLWIWILIAVAATLILILSGIMVFLRPRILQLQGAPEFIKVEM